MLVVLDTNVVVSGALWKGNPATILKAWSDGDFDVVASPQILWEYREVLIEVEKKAGKRQVRLCRDPDDDKSSVVPWRPMPNTW